MRSTGTSLSTSIWLRRALVPRSGAAAGIARRVGFLRRPPCGKRARTPPRTRTSGDELKVIGEQGSTTALASTTAGATEHHRQTIPGPRPRPATTRLVHHHGYSRHQAVRSSGHGLSVCAAESTLAYAGEVGVLPTVIDNVDLQ